MTLKLVLNEPGPDFIGLPNGVEVALRFGDGDLFEEDAIEEEAEGDVEESEATLEAEAVAVVAVNLANATSSDR